MLSYYALAILLALIQSQFKAFLLPLGVIIFAAGQKKDPAHVYGLAFTVGLLVDLVSGRLFGTTAIFLLVSAALTVFWTRDFEASWKTLALVFILLAIGYGFMVTRLGF
ncbi:hypothetical protein A2721_02940 [Candidatus Gottesmanbacteria bacterium RIFCSPHIGHO2_01_FULL_47_48]|uniref:Rod shape-determining protein MreD n=1 Tax=Candidatus Gottesmanbacteria bacterium RIFCSPHIGHO2_01_FULL_47_48 TaxID=1798381 RepID=A0A1F6A536_9BACT|nr:MAG: hypothetical protein A2721_02940 [Candidatus Gottesmanbacteria bacterium RIFCSPHIGHO2_01_FULL_47_48]